MLANLLAVAGVVIPFLGIIALWLIALEKAAGKRSDDPLNDPRHWGKQ